MGKKEKTYTIIDETPEVEPMVSVSMLTYNHQDFIAEAIESVMMQETTFDVVLVIADDCSTDNTRKIIVDFQKRFPQRIKLILQNSNVGASINSISIVENLAGKFIALCEGDDYWTDPLKLQKQVDFLEKNSEYSLCFHNALEYVEGNKEEKNKPFSNIENREYSGEEILRNWTIPTASVIFKKDAYKKTAHPDFMVGDTILFLDVAEYGKMWGMKEMMSVYRKHSGGATYEKTVSIPKIKNFIKHHYAIKESYNGKYSLLENEILSKTYLELSVIYMKKINYNFIIYAIKSYRIHPVYFISEIKMKFLRFFNKTKHN